MIGASPGDRTRNLTNYCLPHEDVTLVVNLILERASRMFSAGLCLCQLGYRRMYADQVSNLDLEDPAFVGAVDL
jgi:hypothetical protein